MNLRPFVYSVLALMALGSSSVLAAEWSSAQQETLQALAQQVQENPTGRKGAPIYIRPVYIHPAWKAEVPELLTHVISTGEADWRSPSGFSALQVACMYGDETAVRALLAAGADVNARPAEWERIQDVANTPLGMLIGFTDKESAARRVSIAKLLLDAGADPDAPMYGHREKISPFCVLRGYDENDDMRALLLEYGNQNMKERTKGWRLSWYWYTDDVIRKLVEGGVDPNSYVGEKAQTLMHVLLRRGSSVELIKTVIEKGARVDGESTRSRYFPPYAFMIKTRLGVYTPEEAVSILRLLLDNGADINALNAAGNSLRIHYGMQNTPAAKAIGAELRARGAKLHPDAR
jgi:ankyrin repeat protein